MIGEFMDKDSFYQLLRERRSIRKYKSDPVSKEIVERLLGAAMEAPSGKNRQNWKFVVVTGKKRDAYLQYSQKSWQRLKDILKVRLKPSLYDFTERFFYTLGDAPVLIFCYAVKSPEEKDLTSIGSVYMAVENINLACLVEGLGCCTMGAPLEIKDEVNRFLGAEEWEEYKQGQLELLCMVAVGYPDHQPPKAPRQTEGRVVWLQNE
jgi:nitroreductase